MSTKDLFTGDWFPYYFERFDGSDRVAVMTLAEEGAYHRAIRMAWKYGTVPADPKVLASKIQKQCTPKIATAVLGLFEPLPENPARMFHPTVEEIRLEQQHKHLIKVRGGKASAKARKQKALNATATKDSAVPTQPPQSQIKIQNQTDLKRLIKRLASENPKIDARFVEIGALYTLLQRNGDAPIRSTKYFVPEIEKVATEAKGIGDNTVSVMLESYRHKVFQLQGWTCPQGCQGKEHK